MKKLSVAFSMAIIAIAFLFSKCAQNQSSSDSQRDSATIMNNGYESQVKWGEHLVKSMSCGDCHTPKKMGAHGPEDDSSLLLSGHPAKMPLPDVDRKGMEGKGLIVTQDLTEWIGPWGVSYTANITSDTTGIGMWSEDQFIYCIRNGVLKGLPNSRPLLPPMPWTSFRNLSDNELKAIFSYLKSTKPVENVVPPPAPPASAPI